MKKIEKSENEIKDEINRLLNRPISDTSKVVEIIVDAITSKWVDPSLVDQAVKQTVSNYENKLRVFAIAAANRQLKRIMRLINLLDDIEDEIDVRYPTMKDQDLIRLYITAQANLNTSLDYIKKVMDFRLELGNAQASMITAQQQIDVDATGVPILNVAQRDRVRRVVQGIRDHIINEPDDDVIASDEDKKEE